MAEKNHPVHCWKEVCITLSLSSKAVQLPSNLPLLLVIAGSDNKTCILHIRLGSGVPGGLALVQVDRDGHGGKDADDDDHDKQLDESEALLPLARRFSAFCTLFILESSLFQSSGEWLQNSCPTQQTFPTSASPTEYLLESQPISCCRMPTCGLPTPCPALMGSASVL